MIKYLFLLLFLSFNVKADYLVGYAHGYHIGQAGLLNDSHPFLGYEENRNGILLYVNSYEKTGILTYRDFYFKDGNLKFNTLVGITTGYKKKMRYRGRSFMVDRRFFFTDDLMLAIVPGITYINKNSEIGLTLLGNSVNFGIIFRFK